MAKNAGRQLVSDGSHQLRSDTLKARRRHSTSSSAGSAVQSRPRRSCHEGSSSHDRLKAAPTLPVNLYNQKRHVLSAACVQPPAASSRGTNGLQTLRWSKGDSNSRSHPLVEMQEAPL